MFFRLPAGGFLLQRGHRPVKDKPHGVIPFDFDPQLPAATDHIGRQLEKQQAEPFEPGGLKRLGQAQTADAVEKLPSCNGVSGTTLRHSSSRQ